MVPEPINFRMKQLEFANFLVETKQEIRVLVAFGDQVIWIPNEATAFRADIVLKNLVAEFQEEHRTTKNSPQKLSKLSWNTLVNTVKSEGGMAPC